MVSTVSGGSLFGGAWLAARSRGESDEDFLEKMGKELQRGFVLRSIRPIELLKALIPGFSYTRTNLVAGTFDRIFFYGMALRGLPRHPLLCINTTILNNSQVGKFSREGFSAWGVVSDAKPSWLVPIPNFPLALAVGASAAFPVGLPPLRLTRKWLPESVRFEGALKGSRSLALTDGGVLENLGTQSLFKSRRFQAWDMVVSDAGTRGKLWRSESWLNPLRSFGVWLFSGRILDQLMLVMNDKENRWAREQVVDEIYDSWMAEALRSGPPSPSLEEVLAAGPALPRRRVLFVRVAQGWENFLGAIPRYRLVELGATAGLPTSALPPPDAAPRLLEDFLKRAGVDLTHAVDAYARLGGDAGARAVNEVATNFTALSARTVDRLEAHAAWQIHASHAVYWD